MLLRGIRQPRLVLVTGAGSGIGRATARKFAAAGATVVVTDIDLGTARETTALITAAGGNAHTFRLDVTDAEAWEALAVTLRGSVGVPDVVVNNAGLAIVGRFLDQSLEDWRKVIDVDLWGVIHGCRVFGREMAASGRRGHIVNVASCAAYGPCGPLASYCVSKAAVRMLSESLRIELSPHDIGVSAICPGAVATNIVGHTELRNNHEISEFDAIRSRVSDLVATLGPKLGFGPNHIANAIHRAVRYNLAVVPVRPESWALYAASRVSPGMVRGLSGVVADGHRLDLALRVARPLVDRIPGSVKEMVLGPEPSPAFVKELQP
ncbi:SDR family NAD(P)-dependent oxidoreductase [Nocardia huaxiensis]|uniref:SDR family NAD(P)-dependent oxidoreductase n=1 Tax=Nocardia huaxiensis TaxID=2755382 RepID=A0A7D6VAA6_9NOCA|nr:SDR family NAD(P)-dependent oxidoreductase [Nocardia huaxiensis]QLY28037.1 SDR family NAD(P)-dependent oxidoreductase [Nocardia huaxiensis]